MKNTRIIIFILFLGFVANGKLFGQKHQNDPSRLLFEPQIGILSVGLDIGYRVNNSADVLLCNKVDAYIVASSFSTAICARWFYFKNFYVTTGVGRYEYEFGRNESGPGAMLLLGNQFRKSHKIYGGVEWGGTSTFFSKKEQDNSKYERWNIIHWPKAYIGLRF